MLNFSKKTAVLLVSALFIPYAVAGDITQVELTGIKNERIVKIRFKGDPVIPKAIARKRENRITLNFEGANSLLGRNILQYNDPVLANIAISKLGNTTQVAVNSKNSSDYRLVRKGKEIWLYIESKPQENAIAQASEGKLPSFTASRKGQNPLSLDFRRLGDSGGTVLLQVSAGHQAPTVKKYTDRLELLLKDYKPYSEVQNSYDVTEFNTVVRKVTVSKKGNDALVTIYNNASSWEYDLKDNGAQIAVEIKTDEGLISDGQVLSGKRTTGGAYDPYVKYQGGKISLDFQDVDVRTVLQILAKEADINIVASDAVRGKLTLKLDNVRWDEALHLVLQAKNLGMRKVGSIINIAPRQEFEAQDRQELNLEREQNQLGSLQSRTFRVKYKTVKDFQAMMQISNKDSGNSILSKRGSLMIDPGSNTLIVTDLPVNLNKFERMLQQVDIPRDQVMISARIVEVKDDYSRDFGMRLGSLAEHNRGQTSIGGATINSSDDNSGSGGGSAGQGGGLPSNVNFPFSGNSSSGYGAFSIIRNTKSAIVELLLAAMQEERKAKIISSPHVLALNGEEALLEDGVDVQYRVKQGGDEGYTTQFKRAVTSLHVVPQITPDGNVILDVAVKKDAPNPQDGSISVKTLNTKAMVEDGGTLVLGGIYDETTANGVRKIPFLGNIPVLGSAFKTSNNSRNRREVLIFLTPRVVKASEGRLEY